MKLKYLFGLLVLTLVTVWTAVFVSPDENLHVIACDVGQGDAILITQKSNQILIDGGPSDAVVDCLSHHMPFWDNTIELVILTHPQLDHYGGLVKVFEKYNVAMFLGNTIDASSQRYGLLKNEIADSQAQIVTPVDAREISMGLIHLDIIHPDSNFYQLASTPDESNEEKSVLGITATDHDPNDFSIVAKLSFGDFDALFTGDIGPAVIDKVVESGKITDVEYIKVPHHGSRNGMDEMLLDAASPEVAVISDGKNNKFGHPHKEILDMFNAKGVKIFRTDLEGDVEIISDGKEFWRD